MTRAAVEEGFEQFVGDAIEQTATEFSISAVIGGGGTLDQLIGDSNVLQERVVEPELEAYEQETIDQFGVILDWVESDEDFDTYAEEILAAGPFTESLSDDLSTEQRDAVEEQLLARHRGLGEAVTGLVGSGEDAFWAAARAELDKETAVELVEEQFAFTGPLEEHRDAFEMVATIDPEELLGGLGGMFGGSTFDVEYTDEAMRAMRHAERAVIAEAKAEVNERFEE
ncbi:hypothetical protein [Halovenus halobia]|uniref:hypothetical protein n=1 Tax=Halovenus halobia TaxID=3396622 RepID=UPI003F570076